jgi:hypothetical protein
MLDTKTGVNIMNLSQDELTELFLSRNKPTPDNRPPAEERLHAAYLSQLDKPEPEKKVPKAIDGLTPEARLENFYLNQTT